MTQRHGCGNAAVPFVVSLPHARRAQLTAAFFELGITRTRDWIARRHPAFNEAEITLEYIRLMHYEPGHISEDQWRHVPRIIQAQLPPGGTAASPQEAPAPPQ
ncbi:MAG: hypothetical protein NW241_16085 [Bacteroidia bacterium]|nr:hypothetical protein [Bacteroidia bacterium]